MVHNTYVSTYVHTFDAEWDQNLQQLLLLIKLNHMNLHKNHMEEMQGSPLRLLFLSY